MPSTPPGFTLQGIGAMPDGAQIAGISFQSMASGTLSADTPYPRRIGDILVSSTTGKMYIASSAAAATSSWKLVTSA